MTLLEPEKFVETFRTASTYEEHLVRLMCEGVDVSSDEEFFDFCLAHSSSFAKRLAELEQKPGTAQFDWISPEWAETAAKVKVVSDALGVAKRCARLMMEDHPEYREKYRKHLVELHGEEYVRNLDRCDVSAAFSGLRFAGAARDSASSYVKMMEEGAVGNG